MPTLVRRPSCPKARVLAGCALAVVVQMGTTGLRAEDLSVGIDEARLLRLDGQGAEVIVGNPSIADVAVQSGRLLVLTGKSFGFTNVIVLDAERREILNRKVRVTSDQTRLVTLHKGTARLSYVCSPVCESTLVPGDAPDYFDSLSKEISVKFGVANSAIAGGPSGQ